jgi:exopolyphosphatase/guanosine-5'-triphosphate,3'-diphosphate pyrophosphatase
MDVGALDLGSNSFHMLVASVGGGVITKLGSQKHTLRLGAHVQRAGFIPETPFREALDAVCRLVDYARTLCDARVVAVGTSALRDAANGAEFVGAVSEATGVRVEIVSGELEARLVYEGARSGLHGLPPRVGVVDIGGGSVEIAIGQDGTCLPVASLPLGFLRLGRSRGLGGSVDLHTGIERVRGEGRHVHALAAARRLAPEAWVFCGGTARAFHAVARRIAGVERTLSARVVREVAAFLCAADRDLLLAQGVDSARVETLGAGAVVLSALVDALEARAIAISPGGLREGVVLREAGVLGIETKRRSAARHAPILAFQ